MAAVLTPQAIQSLKLQRMDLLDELHSDGHFAATETITYGDHDPFDIPVMKCDKCGSVGELQREERPNGSNKYFVRCTGCGNFHKSLGSTPDQGKLLWNVINPKGLKYTDFPMFGLSNLTPEEARVRMVGIRRNLEIRENLASIETTLFPIMDRRPPANMYRKRLKLYVHWAMWSQAAIRVELPAKPRKSKHNQE